VKKRNGNRQAWYSLEKNQSMNAAIQSTKVRLSILVLKVAGQCFIIVEECHSYDNGYREKVGYVESVEEFCNFWSLHSASSTFFLYLKT